MNERLKKSSCSHLRSHSLSCHKKGELVSCPLWLLSSAHLLVLLGPWVCRHKARVVVGWQVTVIPSRDSSDLGGTGSCLLSWWLSLSLTFSYLLITLRNSVLPNHPDLRNGVDSAFLCWRLSAPTKSGFIHLCTHSCLWEHWIQNPSKSWVIKKIQLNINPLQNHSQFF